MHQKRRPGSTNNNGSNNNHRNHRNNNGRNKYRSGGGSGGGGYDSQNVARIKKHAQTQKEKYQNMARDAQVNGERVDAEYYFQHVEHYTRVLAEIEANEPKQERREERQPDERTGEREFSQQDAQGEQSDEAPAAMEQAQEHAAADEMDANDGEEDAAPAQASMRAPRGRRRASPRPSGANLAHDAEEIPLPASVIPQVIAVDSAAG